MDYDKDLGLYSVRQPYTDVYTVMKQSIACERFERFRKSRNGHRSQDNYTNVRSLKYELCSALYPIHIQCTYERPLACPQILEKMHAHCLSQRHLCTDSSTYCFIFHLYHLISSPCYSVMHATAASPAPSPTAPVYSTWASTRVSPRSPPSAPSSQDDVERGGSSCRIGGRRLLH